jgi:predicted Zn-dependent protease
MITIDELASGTTLAESQGWSEELGRAAAELAGREIEAGRLDTARQIVEGLAVTNPHDPAPWAMLALIQRRRGKVLAARVCAETAYHLAPADAQVRLVRAEVLLCTPDDRPRARAELAALVPGGGEVAERARALLIALGA